MSISRQRPPSAPAISAAARSPLPCVRRTCRTSSCIAPDAAVASRPHPACTRQREQGEGATRGQSWPSRPLRIVVPFAAGAGVLDIMARLVGRHLAEALGQQVVIDNRPGAGGIVGAEVVAKAEPDGYTLLMGNTALMVAPYLYARLPFDPLADFVSVSLVNSAPLLLVVHPSVPAQSV